METIKSSKNLVVSIWGAIKATWSFANSKLTLYEIALLALSWHLLCQTKFGGLTTFAWVRVSFVTGVAYVNELLVNVPFLGRFI